MASKNQESINKITNISSIAGLIPGLIDTYPIINQLTDFTTLAGVYGYINHKDKLNKFWEDPTNNENIEEINSILEVNSRVASIAGIQQILRMLNNDSLSFINDPFINTISKSALAYTIPSTFYAWYLKYYGTKEKNYFGMEVPVKRANITYKKVERDIKKFEEDVGKKWEQYKNKILNIIPIADN